MAMYPSIGETPDVVSTKKTLQSPNAAMGAFNLGGNVTEEGVYQRGQIQLRDSGDSVGIINTVTGIESTTPTTPIMDGGTATGTNLFPGIGPTMLAEGNAFRYGSFGGDGSESLTVSGDEIIAVPFTQIFTAEQTIHKWRGTQGKMHYRFTDTSTADGEDTFVYTSQGGDPIDFDNPTDPFLNEVTYRTLNPQYLIKDHVMLVEWFSADGNPITMLGETIGGVFVPFFETKYCDIQFKGAASEQYVSDFYASTGFTGGITETVLADTSTPVKIAGTYVNGNLKNFTATGGVITATQEAVDGFTTNSPREALNLRGTASLTLTPATETDEVTIGIYRNGTLVPNTLVAKTLSAVFGTPTSPEFEMYATLTDTTEADDFDIRIVNGSNATNITATDCRLEVTF